jgi:hypothetical protein
MESHECVWNERDEADFDTSWKVGDVILASFGRRHANGLGYLNTVFQFCQIWFVFV